MTSGLGFIGLGQIGRPMARRLVDHPAGLWVFDVDDSASSALADVGAKVAASPRELAERVRHVSVMVRDDAQVRAVLEGPDGVFAGAAPGTVVAIHSTIHPDTARAMYSAGAGYGVAVLDVPVSGGARAATDGTLALLVGGDSDAVDADRDVLERMGSLVLHLGPIGAGTVAKLARNLLHFTAFTAAFEAAALATAAGIDVARLGEVVRHTDAITGGPGAILYRGAVGPVERTDGWYAILDHVRQLGEKDLMLATELGDRLGVDTPLGDYALAHLAAALGVGKEES